VAGSVPARTEEEGLDNALYICCWWMTNARSPPETNRNVLGDWSSSCARPARKGLECNDATGPFQIRLSIHPPPSSLHHVSIVSS
jgi:hypothetical protein